MSLDDINSLSDKRTPEHANLVFEKQIEEIDTKIKEWVNARKLLLTLQKAINSASYVDEREISVEFLPAEAIVLGNINDYSRERTDFDTLLSFYQDISKNYPGFDLNYPVWAAYSQEQLKQKQWHNPDRYYFYNPEGYDRRPAALYAIGYKRGGYGSNDDLFIRLENYIEKHSYEICGDAYEEYPINEICATNDSDYLVRIMITVRKIDKEAEDHQPATTTL